MLTQGGMTWEGFQAQLPPPIPEADDNGDTGKGRSGSISFLWALLILLGGLAIIHFLSSPETTAPAHHKPAAPSLEQAVKLFKKGDYRAAYGMFAFLAAEGVEDARDFQALMLATGMGVTIDYDRALDLGQNSRDPRLQEIMGVILTEGRSSRGKQQEDGVRPDFDTTY